MRSEGREGGSGGEVVRPRDSTQEKWLEVEGDSELGEVSGGLRLLRTAGGKREGVERGSG